MGLRHYDNIDYLLYYVILHTILPHESHIVKIETLVVVGDIKLMQRNCETRTKKVCRDVPSSSGECVDTCSDACQWVWTWRHAGPDVEVLEKVCKVPTCRNTCKKLKRHVSNSDSSLTYHASLLCVKIQASKWKTKHYYCYNQSLMQLFTGVLYT